MSTRPFPADGNTLYFSSDHPDGWGGYDLYRVDRLNRRLECEPKLLSRAVNTTKDEQFPYLDADTLYFASSGHTGMGGLDIYRSYIRQNGNWSPAQNLKPPINSSGDDFAYIIDRNSKNMKSDVLQIGYFSSTRKEGIGSDDIYQFEKIILPPEPVVDQARS